MTSVRRSVVIATALVVSQALLCAVIGWVTFDHHDRSGSSAEAAGPVLTPPVVVPSASVRPVLPSRTLGESRLLRNPTKADEPTIPTQSPPVSLAPPSAAPPSAAPSSAGPPLGFQAEPSPSESAIQQDAIPGKPCDPAGADGITHTGQAVRCRKGRSGDLIWRIA
jgi:hypothetical protein